MGVSMRMILKKISLNFFQPPNSSGEMPAEEAMLSLHYDIFDLSQNIVGTLIKPLFCESRAYNIPCNNSRLSTLI
jgi:hypothetical protein